MSSARSLAALNRGNVVFSFVSRVHALTCSDGRTYVLGFGCRQAWRCSSRIHRGRRGCPVFQEAAGCQNLIRTTKLLPLSGCVDDSGPRKTQYEAAHVTTHDMSVGAACGCMGTFFGFLPELFASILLDPGDTRFILNDSLLPGV